MTSAHPVRISSNPNRGLAARIRGKPDLPRLETSDPDAWFVRKAYEAWNTGGSISAPAARRSAGEHGGAHLADGVSQIRASGRL